ncbi:MAG: hypothetical protein BGO07_04995 [Alphaproteobacteria bacterium 40-19]|nr:MAG: hypothetical protein BGO07_04995 [Alphaproteobacteria bacterium 40-19]
MKNIFILLTILLSINTVQADQGIDPVARKKVKIDPIGKTVQPENNPVLLNKKEPEQMDIESTGQISGNAPAKQEKSLRYHLPSDDEEDSTPSNKTKQIFKETKKNNQIQIKKDLKNLDKKEKIELEQAPEIEKEKMSMEAEVSTPEEKVSETLTQTPRSKKISEEQAVKDTKIGKTKGIGKKTKK